MLMCAFDHVYPTVMGGGVKPGTACRCGRRIWGGPIHSERIVRPAAPQTPPASVVAQSPLTTSQQPEPQAEAASPQSLAGTSTESDHPTT